MNNRNALQNMVSITFILLWSIAAHQPAYSQSSRPVYNLFDQKGDTIKRNTDSATLTSIMISAGKGFRVKSIEGMLARGHEIVESISSESETINVSKLKAVSKPGDRIMLTVKRIAKIVDEKEVRIIETSQMFTIPIK